MKLSPGYGAALQGIAFYPIPDAGYLRCTGPDRAAFLQRQTTNDIGKVSASSVLLTVLTSPAARILDVFTLLQEQSGDQNGLGLLTLPGRVEATYRFLKSRIFFMDQVVLTNASQEWAQIDLLGPGVEALLRQVGGQLPQTSQWLETELGGVPARLIHPQAVLGLGYRLLIPMQSAGQMKQVLITSGAVGMNPEEVEILRVEMGRPGAGNELTEDFTPLETGLEEAISDSKGCYTGQEIIARQITYDKVTQRLCGLRLESPVAQGERVLSEGKNSGMITSSAVSPRFGPLALAIIKRPHFQPGTELQVGTAGEGAPAVVVELPFK